MPEPTSLFIPAAIIAAFSVPLVLGLVPPNRGYGIRTAQTMSDKETWYKVNRFGGVALLAAAGAAAMIFHSNPELSSGRSFSGILILVLLVFLALVITGFYSRSISRGNG